MSKGERHKYRHEPKNMDSRHHGNISIVSTREAKLYYAVLAKDGCGICAKL